MLNVPSGLPILDVPVQAIDQADHEVTRQRSQHVSRQAGRLDVGETDAPCVQQNVVVFFASIKPTFEIIVYQRSRYLGRGAIHGRSFDTPRCRHDCWTSLVRLHRFASEFRVSVIVRSIRCVPTSGGNVRIAGRHRREFYLNRICDRLTARTDGRANRSAHEERPGTAMLILSATRAAPDSWPADIAHGHDHHARTPRAIGRDANMFATLQCANWPDQRCRTMEDNGDHY